MKKVSLLTSIIAGSMLLVGAANAQEKLVLYTSQPNTDAQQTVDAFMAANPGIQVEWVRDGTSKLMTKLQAEIAAGAPQPDVLLIADTVTLEGLKKDGHLQAYKSPEAANYDAALFDAEGFYHSTKLITTGIAYNTAAAMKPTSWADLTNEKAKGLVIMPSPLYSGAALIHMSAMEEAGMDISYYEQLKANETVAVGGNGAVFKAVASGEEAYGVLVDFLAIREKANGSPVEFVFPKEGVSYVTEPVAILSTAKNVPAAQKFVDFLLSEEGQKLVVSQGYLPARNGMEGPAGFPPRSEIKLMTFDPAAALANAEENKKKFEAIFGAQ